jgi:tetratricopeptide (TPR) repeat protein
MQPERYPCIFLYIIISALIMSYLFGISDCLAQVTTDQNSLAKYQAICGKVMPSLAVVYGIDYGELFIKTELSLDIDYKGDSAWGCVINEDGDMVTSCNLAKQYENASGYTCKSVQFGWEESQPRGFSVKKVISKSILNDYMILSANMDKSEYSPFQISTAPIQADESIYIFRDPCCNAGRIVAGRTIAITTDPMLGEIVIIETEEWLQPQMAVAVNSDGELYGFILSARPTDNTVFAFSAKNLIRFASGGDKDIAEFRNNVRFQIDQNIKKPFTNGLILFWKGDYDSAQSLFDKVLKTKPDHALTYIYCGACQLNLSNVAGAEEYYLKAYELNDVLDEAQYQLARLYLEQDRTDDAIDAYNKAISSNGNNPFYYYELGLIYKDLGKKKATQKILAKLKRLDKILAEKLME